MSKCHIQVALVIFCEDDGDEKHIYIVVTGCMMIGNVTKSQ